MTQTSPKQVALIMDVIIQFCLLWYKTVQYHRILVQFRVQCRPTVIYDTLGVVRYNTIQLNLEIIKISNTTLFVHWVFLQLYLVCIAFESEKKKRSKHHLSLPFTGGWRMELNLNFSAKVFLSSSWFSIVYQKTLCIKDCGSYLHCASPLHALVCGKYR